MWKGRPSLDAKGTGDYIPSITLQPHELEVVMSKCLGYCVEGTIHYWKLDYEWLEYPEVKLVVTLEYSEVKLVVTLEYLKSSW